MAVPEDRQRRFHWHYPRPRPALRRVDHVAVDTAVDRRGWLIAAGLAAGLILAGLLGWMIADRSEAPPVPDAGVTLADVVADPEAFLGQTVVIRGEIGDFVAPTLFVLSEANADESLLVLGDQDLPQDIPEGSVVEVAGEVALVDEAFVEEFGPFDEAADVHVGTVVVFAGRVEEIAPT